MYNKEEITINVAGAGYSTVPAITITGGNGNGATATATAPVLVAHPFSLPKRPRQLLINQTQPHLGLLNGKQTQSAKKKKK